MASECEKIELPLTLGLKVSEILREKHGIQPRKNSMGLLDISFTQEELSLITSLEFTNPTAGSLEGLHYLPNLKTLKVVTHGITAHMQSRNIPSINDVDVKEISKCTQLRSLSIVNQAKLTDLDVSKLENLEELVVSHNQHLEEVYGMEKLKKLWVLKCYGNNRLHSIEGLEQAIIQNPELMELNLDVLLFPNAIGYNPGSGQYNSEALSQIQNLSQEENVLWSESLTGNRAITINTYQMIQLHNKSCEILADNISPSADTRNIIIGIENYIARNIIYDDDGRKHGHTRGGTTSAGVRIIEGPIGGTNCAYNAIVHNTCVCEGYTRAMQYLLKLKGINSHNVDCYAEKDTTHMSTNKEENQYTTYTLPKDGYHSIICIDDYYNLYDDPCWNACMYQRGDTRMSWVLLTKEEISQDHTLSFDERSIENNHLKQPRNVIQDSIKSNNLFRQARVRSTSVNDTRRNIVKGQIIQREEQEI